MRNIISNNNDNSKSDPYKNIINNNNNNKFNNNRANNNAYVTLATMAMCTYYRYNNESKAMIITIPIRKIICQI